MPDAYRPKGLSSAVSYQDSKAAYKWLEAAFGFEPLFVILDADGNLAHSEMTYGNSVVMIGNEWSDGGERKGAAPPIANRVTSPKWSANGHSAAPRLCCRGQAGSR